MNGQVPHIVLIAGIVEQKTIEALIAQEEGQNLKRLKEMLKDLIKAAVRIHQTVRDCSKEANYSL